MSLIKQPLLLAAVLIATFGVSDTRAQSPADDILVRRLHAPGMPTHMRQHDLLFESKLFSTHDAFLRAFLHGDALFDTEHNAIDGIGANVGQGQRFSRVPRSDLNAPGQWARHHPQRATGPNAQSCTACHGKPIADGAGGIEANAIRDPLHSGDPTQMIQRNTPHLFGMGAVQRVAEEMTTELHAQRDALESLVLASGSTSQLPLHAKGISFGTLAASPDAIRGVVFDHSQVTGIDRDLVVRPFQWKGSVASVRDFNRGAAHNEIGLQAIELVGYDFDGDGDGVTNELTVGDMTALTIYVAAQPRPVRNTELVQLGLGPAMTFAEIQRIDHGEQLFAQIGCAECHVPSLEIEVPLFQEPSAHPAYRDRYFPAGQDPRSEGVDPNAPIGFDLTRDVPQNQVVVNGQLVRLGSLESLPGGRAVARTYGDLKRHDMGPGLAESIDETGSGSSVFLTENLWGCASTAPYLHDGRATTLAEAILWHGGEAQQSADAFRNLSFLEQQDLLSFLGDHVLWRGGLPIGR